MVRWVRRETDCGWLVSGNRNSGFAEVSDASKSRGGIPLKPQSTEQPRPFLEQVIVEMEQFASA